MATPPSIPRIRYSPLATLSTLEFWWQPPIDSGNAPIVSYSLLCSSISYSAIIGPSSFYAKVSTLVNCQDHQFQLAATNTAGTSPYVPFKYSQPGILAAGVTSITTVEQTNTSLKVLWSMDSKLNESINRSFVITGKPSDLSISTLYLRAYPNQRDMTVNNIVNSMPYTFYAQAVNDAGWSFPNVSSIFTSGAPPTPLMDLNASNYNGAGSWYDDTENGYDATLENGVIGLNPSGNGIILDGSTNWVFPDVGVANSWSIAVWYKQIAAPTGNACIISQIQAEGAFNMTILGSGQAFFYNGDSAVGTPVTLENGVWTNIMTTWDGTNLTTYINGSSIGTTVPEVIGASSGESYRIGRMWSSPEYVTGEIGRVTVWDTPLLAANAQSYYNSSYENYAAQTLLHLQASSYSGSGSWQDESGYGRDATIENGVIALNASGNGIILDGSTNWMFPNVEVANSWSIAVWYKQIAAPPWYGYACIITQININATSFNMTLLRHGQGQFYNEAPAYGTSVTLENGVWTNIMVTWDGTNMTTYINGSSIGTTVPGLTAADGGSFYRIGRMWDSPQYVSGEIGQVTVWNSPLLASQALSYFNNYKNTYNVNEVLILQAVSYSGTGSWNDTSGNGNNATLENGAIAKNSLGNGIVFNGSTSWTFPNVSLGNAWTLAVWYKQTVANENAAIISQMYNNSSINAYITGTGLGGFYAPSNNNGASVTLVTGMWTHIVVTWDGTNLRTYINGSILGSTQPGGTAADGGLNYTIGRNWAIQEYVTGEIGEIRIFDGPISPNTVSTIYNNTHGLYYNNIVLLQAVSYSGTGSWNDTSGNGNNASLEEGAIAKNSSNNGIVLNGSTYWSFPNPQLGNAWTVSVWYKQTGEPTGPNACILVQEFSINYMNFLMSGTGTCSFYPASATGPTVSLTTGVWAHILSTWNGTNLSTYINGTLFGTTTPGGSAIDSGQRYRIGRMWDGEQYVIGEIGEVRIYDGPILPSLVSIIYNNTFATFTFNPSISGVQLWLDGADPSSITLSGTAVAQWSDKSGNNNHATGVGTPTVTSQGVLFNGTNSAFTTPYSGSNPNETAFIVVKVTNIDAQNDLISASGGGDREYLLFGGGTVGLTTGGGANFLLQTGGTITNDQKYMLEFTRSVTDVNFYTDGNLITANTGTYPTSGTGTTTIGAYYDGVGGFLTGVISEIIVYNRVLQISERQTVEGYLAWKWQLQSQLPSNHPYKLVPPEADALET